MEAVQERSLIAKNCKLFCTSFLVFSFVHKEVPPTARDFCNPCRYTYMVWRWEEGEYGTWCNVMNDKPLGDVDEMQYISSRSYTCDSRSKQRHEHNLS